MAKLKRLAALDVGGNTVHLLISLRPVAQRVDLLELRRATASDRTFSRATIRRLAKTVRSFAAAVRKADARLIAAATCSDGVKPTIGYSMPSRSQSGVRSGMAQPPACTGAASGAAAVPVLASANLRAQV